MEVKATPKSAPAGGRKGSIKKDAISTNKEINNWIHKGNKDHEIQRKAARNFNLLTENVTEERMLYARQLELGRERYKFLANHDYEKQKFLERQQMKEKMMKKFMSSARKVIDKAYSEKPKKVLTIRIPQADQSSPLESPTEEDVTSLRAHSVNSKASSKVIKRPGSEIPPIESRPTRARSPFKKPAMVEIQKPDKRSASHPRKLGVLRNSSSSTKKRSQSERPATSSKPIEYPNSRPSSDTRGFYVNTSGVNDDSKKLPSVHSPYNGCMYSVGNPQNFRNTNQSKSVRYKDHPAPIATLKRTHTFSGPVSNTKTWINSQTTRTFGERFDTSIGDPRYQALTSTLVGVDDFKSPRTSVRDIIAANEVLRSASKSEGAANAKKMHAKFIALILEKELK